MFKIMITKVEQGLEGDDFVHDRKTLRVELAGDEIYPCKLYSDGRIVGFYNFLLDDDEVYEEHILEPELEKEIRAKL